LSKHVELPKTFCSSMTWIISRLITNKIDIIIDININNP
jgi:hypothetical protein